MLLTSNDATSTSMNACDITSNSAGLDGGGLKVTGGATMLANSTFVNNSAGGQGGALMYTQQCFLPGQSAFCSYAAEKLSVTKHTAADLIPDPHAQVTPVTHKLDYIPAEPTCTDIMGILIMHDGVDPQLQLCVQVCEGNQRLVNSCSMVSSGAEGKGPNWDGLSDALKNRSGLCSILASEDNKFRRNSAVKAGGALFLSDLGSAYFNCSSQHINTSQLANAEETCPNDWSGNTVNAGRSQGYGPDLASLPSKMHISAPSLDSYISDGTPTLPIVVSFLDQADTLIVTGDYLSRLLSCVA